MKFCSNSDILSYNDISLKDEFDSVSIFTLAYYLVVQNYLKKSLNTHVI